MADPSPPARRRDPAWAWYGLAIGLLALVGVLDLTGVLDMLRP